jgi:hypothetical protein
MTPATFEFPNEHRLNALDALARARAMLTYVLDFRADAERTHEGENWVLHEVRQGIDQARELLKNHSAADSESA